MITHLLAYAGKGLRYVHAVLLTNALGVFRASIARRYLKGQGIEIGALYAPLKVSKRARVKYVDRLPVEALRRQYPELDGVPLVPVDIVDDGETLATLADGAQDFVIANHFLEHTQNPLQALRAMLRVLKPGGILYLAAPDMRQTFDREREVTPLAHLVRDFQEGPAWSRRAAFEDYVRHVEKADSDAAVAAKVEHYLAMDYSIHYHAWTEWELMEMLVYLKRQAGLSFAVELLFHNHIEIVMILRKGERASAQNGRAVHQV